MKKLYTLSLAALTALSSLAATPQLSEVTAKQATPRLTIEKGELAGKVMDMSAITRRSAKRNVAKADVEGAYIVTIGDWYTSDGKGEYTASAEIGFEEDGMLYVDCDDFWAPFYGSYNEATSTITFEKTYLGQLELSDGTQVKAYAEPMHWDGSTNKIVREGYSVTVADGGLINFPADHGVQWSAYNASTDEYLGGFETFDIVQLESDKNWKSLGSTKFIDNILYPLFFTVQNTEEVEVQVNYNEVEKIYEVVAPFQTVFKNIGSTSMGPNMKIDASDPDNCVIDMMSTSINGGSTDGLYYLLSYSWYMEDPSTTPEANRIKVTQDDNNTTITFPYRSTLVYAATSQKVYYGSKYESKLVLPKTDAVAAIEVAAENAPVEYFNLQGVRISNPVAGQVVIARQGSKVSKQLVK